MKNIKLYILSLMFVLCLSNVSFAYDEPSFSGSYKINNNSEAQKQTFRDIRLVRFASRDADTVSLVSGDAVVYSTVSDDGTTVAKTFISADGSFAGIVCTTIPSADGSSTTFADDAGRRNWGYIITYGVADALVTAGGTNGNAVGDPFVTSRDAGRITSYEPMTVGDANSIIRVQKASANRGGFFFNAADGTSTTVKVFVKAE